MTKAIVLSIVVIALVAGIAFGGFSLSNRNKSKPVEVVVQSTPVVESSPSPTLSPEQKAAIADQQTKQDIGKIAFALQSYYVGHATYPSLAQGLVRLVLDRKLDEVPKPFVSEHAPFVGNDTYFYFVDPHGCKGDEFSPCNDVYVSGSLFWQGHSGNYWCWDSKSGQAREIDSREVCYK
jgi:type II secretory pathway pseudopilin PulG